MDDQPNNTYIPAGPLNIDCRANKVTTVMGTELDLSPAEVKALHILATNEDKFIKFETLCNEVWKTSGKSFDRFEAMHAMNNILRQVEAHGDGFVWIDHEITSGFTYKSKWGQKWQDNNAANTAAMDATKRKIIMRAAIGAVGLVAAAMIFTFTPLFSRTEPIRPPSDDYIYLHAPQVPLGTAPPQYPAYEPQRCEDCDEYEEYCECDESYDEPHDE
ncbi:MAG: hypothetical protein FWC71_10185 [Defluviitaleaceae bacterium]|nr:hypothetical protein [Defluviitaleaceae bacterium]